MSKPAKLRVVIVEPGRYAREAEIDNTLHAEQAVVGGLIDAICPWADDKACLTFFNVSLLASDEFDQWAEVKELNENAIPSVLLGFDFDAAAVKDELMNCTSIYNRYKSELLTGTLDPAVGVPEMMGEMRAAGFDQILQEAQAQVDAFMQSKAR